MNPSALLHIMAAIIASNGEITAAAAVKRALAIHEEFDRLGYAAPGKE